MLACGAGAAWATDAGGPRWQPPHRVATAQLPLAHVFADRGGRALVVWGSGRLAGTRNRVEGTGIRIATSARGGRFSRPRVLARAPFSTFRGAADAGGDIVLAATRETGSCDRRVCRAAYWTTIGRTSGRFTRLASLGRENPVGSTLAIGGTGTAVIAFVTGRGLRYYLRRPGGTFGHASSIDEPMPVDPNAIGAAVGPHGDVLLAWVVAAGTGPRLRALAIASRGRRGRVRTIYASGDFRAPRAAFDGRGNALIAVSSGIGPGDTHAFFAARGHGFGAPLAIPIRFATVVAGSPGGGFAIAGEGPANTTRFTTMLVDRVSARGAASATLTFSDAGLGPWLAYDAAGGLFVAWADQSGPVLTRYIPRDAAPLPPQTVSGDDAGYVDLAAGPPRRAFGLWAGSSLDPEPIDVSVAR